MRGGVTPTPQCQATRALGCDADDTVKSLQEDEKYIDLHMKCEGTHTHRGGRRRFSAAAPPMCVRRHHRRSYANLYICFIFL